MMSPSSPPAAAQEPKWVSDLVRAEPRLPLMAPYLAYLLLMIMTDNCPRHLLPGAIALHILGAAWVLWLFRRHYPAWGRPHVGLGLVVGLLGALLWIGGQYLIDQLEIKGVSLGGSLGARWKYPFLTLQPPIVEDPHTQLGDGGLFWAYACLRLCRAITVVPIVEELFWRGFILRAFVRWHWFDQVPWGQFAWRAFIGSALLSVLQHPGNWGVSIACWLLFNAVFYWRKSLTLLVIIHAVTNLALYIYVLSAHAWRFW